MTTQPVPDLAWHWPGTSLKFTLRLIIVIMVSAGAACT